LSLAAFLTSALHIALGRDLDELKERPVDELADHLVIDVD